ncbi:T9SS C-terminal target domain-containing protein [Hymenobacter lapidiphilus]|uniref:T9SS type A sorting domain-containing protein n=1 Tax=Hymenobacter sp. CCM 8763 TaxID=2303334 RepID=UPI000E34185E|nr:T9SS type A sorting domain-containing protein [Hymenobacter sp. CCM 8763]RFP66544.1 T9SS C-terminal target domain-containing protein [Hymenobacter sp. CCM 8763]
MKIVVQLVAGLLLTTATAQAQWVTQPFSFAQPQAAAAYTDAIDANTAWAMSSALLAPSAANVRTNQVALTVNGGQNWTVRQVTGIGSSETLTSISAISATTAWVSTFRTASGGGRVFKTTDGGLTWVVQSTAVMFSEANSYPNSVYFFNATNGMVMGDVDGRNGGGLEIYYTSDGGATWTRSANVPTGTAGEYGTYSPVAAVGNSIWFPNNEGDIFRSKDRGVTWQVAKQIVPSGDPVSTLAFRDELNGLAVIPSVNDTQHELFSSADGGATWTRLTYTGPLHGFGLVRVPGNGNYLSVGLDLGNGDQGSSYSQDNGKTWIRLESTIDHLFVDAASPTAVWSGNISATGTGANKLTSPVLSARGSTLVLGASLSPNPSANGQFRVQWPAAAHTGAATLTVFDVLGRQVQRRTFDISRGTETKLDLSGEKSGIYQVRLESGSGVSQLRAQVQ